jgi:UDP:flavonoid glycosyltransferase YjiC (YdhE family)
MPFAGHFLPLTGMAMKLKERGHDVRWYSGKIFSYAITDLGIHVYPFHKALEVTQFNIDDVFPERKGLRAGVRKLKFDIKNIFVDRGVEFLDDIIEIHREFPFEVLVSDVAFLGAELVQKVLSVKFVSISVMPLMCTSKDLPPYGMGLLPDYSFLGKMRSSFLRFIAKQIVFKQSTDAYNIMTAAFGIPAHHCVIWDIPAIVADGFVQNGVPEFEYKRSDLPVKIRFAGPLFAYKAQRRRPNNYSWADKVGTYDKTILISQGTAEPFHTKLIIPALEGLKDLRYLLIVATGSHGTDSLREQYRQDNIVIEDFIDFEYIMPKADVFVTNGGFGGTLVGIAQGTPMVAAGINEAKNEICARIGYFKIGINLNTENPTPASIATAVEKVLSDATYKENVARLSNIFKSCDAHKAAADHILDVVNA